MANRPPNIKQIRLVKLLNILAILTWGSLLLKYAVTGQYRLLIHPNYFYLMLATGVLLLAIAIAQLKRLLTQQITTTENETHLTLFAPGVGSSLLLISAIAGLLITPSVLASQTALQRGMTETLPNTRAQPQSFITQSKPESRSLIEWVRTLNAYPEPEAYTGQKAQITGFIINLPELPPNYLLLSRFVLTCCAVDAYPVFIPVELPANSPQYPADTWLEVEGLMTAKTLSIRDRSDTPQEKRRLVLQADQIKPIPTPKNPYSYQ